MDSLNITIDGHLGMPGLARLRMPPPFGTSRDIIETIESRRATALTEEVLSALRIGSKANVPAWRPRLTVIAIGVACTAAAAWIGSYTGQRYQPSPTTSEYHSTRTVEQTAPTLPAQSTSGPVADKAGSAPPLAEATREPHQATHAIRTVDAAAKPAPAVARPLKAAAPAAQPHAIARRPDRKVPNTMQPVVPTVVASTAETNENSWAPSDSVPVTAYVAPGTSVRIDLQRHTRLTD